MGIAEIPPVAPATNEKLKISDKETAKGAVAEDTSSVPSDKDGEVQYGVEKITAITSQWSYTALIVMYICLYITSYTHSMQQQMNFNLAPYVTSSFSRHGLTSTAGIVARLMGGVSQVPLARIINIWGRLEGYIFAHFLCCVGLILLAVSRNVETYAAAQVFWTVGSGWIGYIHTVLISDTTSLRNRMIIYGINSTAYIGNAFAGPAVANLFLKKSSFRWAFGAFAIIFPVIGASVASVLFWNQQAARKSGVLRPRPKSGRTALQSVVFYLKEFDVLGMFFCVAGFSFLLLPFSLVTYAAHGWKTGYIIALPCLGVVMLGMFVAWEAWGASTPLVPPHFFKDRTVVASAGVAGFIMLSWGTWDSYFSSYLQVVHHQSIANAGYIINIYTVASCTWGPIVGYLIRRTNHYKWVAIAAVPLACLATGLLIHFRQPHTYIGYIVMCQIFKAVASGTIIICEQIAVMAAVNHNEITIMLALIALSSSVGGAIGRAISGGIWTNELPGLLLKYLPEAEKPNMTTIYGSLKVQLSYAWGSPTREAIIAAYGNVQRKMVIAGASFMPLALICVFLWKNVNVGKVKQTHGNVF